MLFLLFLENKDNLMLDFFLEENLPHLLNPQGQLIGMQKKTDSTQDVNESDGKIARIFTTVEANLNNELVTKTGAIYQFNVNGN